KAPMSLVAHWPDKGRSDYGGAVASCDEEKYTHTRDPPRRALLRPPPLFLPSLFSVHPRGPPQTLHPQSTLTRRHASLSIAAKVRWLRRLNGQCDVVCPGRVVYAQRGASSWRGAPRG